MTALPLRTLALSLGALAWCAWVCACGGALDATARRPASPLAKSEAGPHADAELPAGIELPTRASHPSPASGPPELPAALRDPPDLTVALEFRGDVAAPSSSRLKTVTRTAQRVHSRVAGADSEWRFVRNPLDERRASGTLIDHRRQVIVEYGESELRLAKIARGWADIVGFGVPPEALAHWETSGRRETVAGYEFEESADLGQASAGSSSLWWSPAVAAPLRMLLAGGGRVTVLRFAREVDESLLVPAQRRFPTYRIFDVADYREEHHGL